ncbi:hypothetical protein Taro_049457, partial [Colocasia esculenta]|nr:hypothetical protein [Colocasia esculenta]
MKSKTNMRLQRSQQRRQAQVEGPNWILIIGGALLSTLSIKLGSMLKEAFDTRRSSNTQNALTKSDCKVFACLCNHYSINTEVAISTMQSARDNGSVMWPSSPERLELPRKPFNQSNSSESPPSVSESGSDIFSKREVIYKLREQVKRRDEMILEMQAQITAIQKTITAHMAQSAHLQSQLDGTKRCLFDSEMEIQRLRKAIADHCVADAGSPTKPVTPQNWHADTVNGHANGFTDGVNDLEFNCALSGKGRDSERMDMLKQEIDELKEVIEGKEFLLQSYREQKTELSTKVKELQLRLTSQVPNML